MRSRCRGTRTMIGFCESLAIDGPVEIVNERELTEVEEIGVQLFAINVSVGLALQIPGVRESVACSLVQKLPFGAGSIVGVRSMGEARQVRAAGADAIMVKKEVRGRPLCAGNHGPRHTWNPRASFEST